MYSNILIPMDPDHADLFDAQVQAARRLLSPDGTISTLYVNPNYVHHVLAATSSESPTEVEQAILQQVKALFEAEVPRELRGHVYSRRGVVHDEIVRKAKSIGADLIIMTACKNPLERYFLGSNTRKVMAEAQCSVFVQR